MKKKGLITDPVPNNLLRLPYYLSTITNNFQHNFNSKDRVDSPQEHIVAKQFAEIHHDHHENCEMHTSNN